MPLELPLSPIFTIKLSQKGSFFIEYTEQIGA